MKLKTYFNTMMAVLINAAILFLPLNAGAEEKPWLGIAVDDLSFQQLDQHSLAYGVAISNVYDGSAAVESGLQRGDILQDFDSLPIFSVERLQWLVGSKAVGDKVSVEFIRDEKRQSAEVILGSMQKYTAVEESGHPHVAYKGAPKSYIGIHLQDLSDGLRDYFSAPDDAGMLIAEVENDTAAAAAGLAAGDVIISMGTKVIRNMDDVRRVLNFFDPGDMLTVELMRSKKKMALDVTVGSKLIGNDNNDVESGYHLHDHWGGEEHGLQGDIDFQNFTHHSYMLNDIHTPSMRHYEGAWYN